MTSLYYYHNGKIAEVSEEQMATIKDIAEIVGTSTTTVSNVLHGKLNKVSSENVERIQKVIEEQKYVLPMGMSVLTSKKSKIIGVVIWIPMHYEYSILADPFYGNVVGVLERIISKAGYYMMLYSSDSLNDIYRMTMAWNVDGLIALTFNYEEYRKLSTMANKPVVAIDLYSDSEEDMYNVGIDDENGGYLMTKYLIECGFQKIFLLSYSDVTIDHLRWRGYRRALIEAGLPYKKENYIILSDYPEKRIENYKRLLPYAGKNCAMFCLADMLAIEVMGYFQKNGCRVPEDISVVGYDDIPVSCMTSPALTTVRQNIARKGEMAGKMMLDILEGNPIEEHNILLPVSLCIRGSVGRPKQDAELEGQVSNQLL